MIPVKGKEAPIPGDILKAAASQGGNSPEITKMERGGLNGNVIEEIFGLMNERMSETKAAAEEKTEATEVQSL
ncbi:hypothetical protein VNO80_00403 [Phaseolus coccineus]|uniref:Uncharacterized protein n=1 Tax=Phaseolus coccineus TaxID=3886 RepID=A0AAN9NYQ2_PHACN